MKAKVSAEKMEAFFRKGIERIMHRREGKSIGLLKLADELALRMEREKIKDGEEFLAPNDYVLMLNVEDYRRLHTERILNALREAAAKEAIRRNFFIDGKLCVRLKKDETVPQGTVTTAASFVKSDEREDNGDHTIVLAKTKWKAPLNLPAEYKTAFIAAKDEDDEDARLSFGEKTIYIGRQSKNDFVLADESVSRLHASIEYKRHRHFIRDEKSTNGTFVNGKAIDGAFLADGDEIRIGETIIVYGVI